MLLNYYIMTYNQVQSFQINDYVDIEINECRALYSESIADRGIAGFISWLGTAGPVDYFKRSSIIRVYQFLLVGYSWAHPWLCS